MLEGKGETVWLQHLLDVGFDVKSWRAGSRALGTLPPNANPMFHNRPVSRWNFTFKKVWPEQVQELMRIKERREKLELHEIEDPEPEEEEPEEPDGEDVEVKDHMVEKEDDIDERIDQQQDPEMG